MKLLLITCLFGYSISLYAQPCETGVLDPRVAHSLQTYLTDLPASAKTSAEQVKNLKMTTPAVPEKDVIKFKITADSIPVQLYNPTHKQGLPIIISFHPGGFVTPMLPFMEYDCWRQAKAYQAMVIAVDYRIAPEYPFPAAVDVAFNAFKRVSGHGQEVGGDTSRIVLLGLSAGGNLAAVVSQKATEAGLGSKIKLQVLNCPSTDHPANAGQYRSNQKYASGYFQTKAFREYSMSVYAPGADLHNPDVSPMQRKDLKNLPQAIIITAEFDIFRDEGYTYASRLREAGVKVTYHCFPGQIHCLLGLPPESAEQKQVDDIIIKAMYN
jgi:acetyl esterase